MKCIRSVVLPLLVVFCIGLFFYFVPQQLKSQAKKILLAFQAPTWRGASKLEDFIDYSTLATQSKARLIQELRSLARENAAHRVAYQYNRCLHEENQRLENCLNLPPREGFRYEVARVCLQSLESWNECIIIRKGKNFGLKEGYGVINAQGVVGKLEAIYEQWALVRLSSSIKFRLLAQLNAQTPFILYQGISSLHFGECLGSAKYLPLDFSLAGDESKALFTTGQDGIFPEGIFIGNLVQVEPDHLGISRQGVVQLPLRSQPLKEVTVLIPLTPEMPIDD